MNKYQINVPLPSQGINLADDSLIGNNEAAEGTLNIRFRNGMPHTRRGYIKHGSTTSSVPITRLGMRFYASAPRLMRVEHGESADTLKESKLSSGSWVSRTIGTVAASKKQQFLSIQCAIGAATYSEKVFIVDGSKYSWFDETTGISDVDDSAYAPSDAEIAAYGTNVLVTTAAEINAMRFIVSDNNRVWLAGNGNLVRVSHLGTSGIMPNYFPSTQALKLKEDCTGMIRYMDEIMLFTENTTTLVSGSTPIVGIDDSYVNVELPFGFGCSAADSIVVGDNALYWANKKGVYRYQYMPTGESIPTCISEFIMPDGHTRTIRKKLDEISDWTLVFAVFFDHEYHLYIGNGEELVFDTINSTWTIYEYHHDFNHGIVYDGKLLYAPNDDDGASTPAYQVYHMEYPFDFDEGSSAYDGLSDDGNAITFVLKSKFFDFDYAANKKRFRTLYFTIYSELVPYVIDLTINLDNEYTTMTEIISNKGSRWGNDDPNDDETEDDYALTWGDTLNVNRTNLNYPVRVKHIGRKYNIQYELRTTGLNNAWLLKAVVLLFKMKRLK